MTWRSARNHVIYWTVIAVIIGGAIVAAAWMLEHGGN